MNCYQLINTREINDNTEKFITVKETGKSKESKLNHQQDYRLLPRNSSEALPIEECQDIPEPTEEDNSMLPSFNHATKKKSGQEKWSTKHHKQPEIYITNN